MDLAEPLWAFLAISVVVIVTPGQDTALTIRNTLAGGRTSGIMTALGIAAGQAVWALATAVGVVAFLVASEPLFAAVKLAGAGYIVFLGGQSLYAAIRSRNTVNRLPNGARPRGLPAAAALRQGLVSNLANPKMAVFFASLLPQFARPLAPQFAPEEGAAFAGLILLGAVFCTMTFAWLTGYALAVARAGHVLRRPGIRRAVEGATGTVLIALGLHIAAARD
jgi:threonine/homoserine/homoserine lactone efflux protein